MSQWVFPPIIFLCLFFTVQAQTTASDSKRPIYIVQEGSLTDTGSMIDTLSAMIRANGYAVVQLGTIQNFKLSYIDSVSLYNGQGLLLVTLNFSPQKMLNQILFYYRAAVGNGHWKEVVKALPALNKKNRPKIITRCNEVITKHFPETANRTDTLNQPESNP